MYPFSSSCTLSLFRTAHPFLILQTVMQAELMLHDSISVQNAQKESQFTGIL